MKVSTVQIGGNRAVFRMQASPQGQQAKQAVAGGLGGAGPLESAAPQSPATGENNWLRQRSFHPPLRFWGLSKRKTRGPLTARTAGNSTNSLFQLLHFFTHHTIPRSWQLFSHFTGPIRHGQVGPASGLDDEGLFLPWRVGAHLAVSAPPGTVRAPLDAYGSTSETTERHIFQRGQCSVTSVPRPQLVLCPLVNETQIAPIVVATDLSGDDVVEDDFGRLLQR